ncbi:winged helix-turn-helix domain-containing protein [Enterococcus rotai]|uniref:winged helix-turn-helix domain-containing protein n=1 Tax=Enterococcus rotai TaxID=118060 RepID=UPI0035C7106E
MNQIETFFFDQQLANKFSMVFKEYQWTVYHHKEENVPLTIKEESKIIFIKSQEKEIAQTIDLLLSIKSKQVFVWVVSEENVQIHMMFMKLGADGALRATDNIEEIALFVTNLYQKIEKERGNPVPQETTLNLEEQVQLNVQSFSMEIEGKEIYFTKKEYQLMEYLYTHVGETASYEELVRYLWKESESELAGEEQKYRIANIVFHIRQKLSKEKIKKEIIQTVRSRGYRINL